MALEKTMQFKYFLSKKMHLFGTFLEQKSHQIRAEFYTYQIVFFMFFSKKTGVVYEKNFWI